MIRIFSLEELHYKCVHILEKYMSLELVQAVVTTFNKETKKAVLLNETYGEFEIFSPLFFGGEFTPHPKPGDIPDVQIDTLRLSDKRVVDAWHHA